MRPSGPFGGFCGAISSRGVLKVVNHLRSYAISSAALILALLLFCAHWPAIASAETTEEGSGSAKQAKKKEAGAKESKAKSRPGIQAEAVYCVEITRNQTLMARNADRPLPVASLTKLATALVVVEKMVLDKKVTVPQEVSSTPKSVVGLKPGDQLTVRDLLHGLLMASGNDCAETLAAVFPGGRGKFIAAMNAKARSLGTNQTVFYNPSGLDRKRVVKEDGKNEVHVKSNMSTAREMARIARTAFSDKTIRSICLKQRHTIAVGNSDRKYSLANTNKLLRDNLPLKGGKTGFTVKAGHCLVTEFIPAKKDLLIVVLGSPDHFRDTRLIYRQALTRTKGPETETKVRKTQRGAQDGEVPAG
jgi:D-alanyl-D-alanine carboxypeptidase